MKAMILAAGLGTRLRPLTNTVPKPLLPVGGTPLIVWNLLLLRRSGIREVVVNLHHLGDLIEKELGDGSTWGMRPFLVLNGDTLCELDLGALCRFHMQQLPIATMVVREDPDADRWGALELEGRRVVRINGRGRVPQGSVVTRMFAGVHIVDPRLLRTIPADRESSIIEAYVHEIQQGEPVLGYTLEGYWSDVGTPERYTAAQDDAERGRVRLADRNAV
jgi:NDP-sugar pyrophosphorylase family protein